MRIGVFGGTFDPPHVGHLIVAEYVREAVGLDRILFVPTATPPAQEGSRNNAGRAACGHGAAGHCAP